MDAVRRLLAGILVAVAACQTTPVPPSADVEPSSAPATTASAAPSAPSTSGPSSSGPASLPSPSAQPSPAPTPTPDASIEGLVVDQVAMVVTDDLRMRSEPGVQASSERLTPLLQRGTLAFVLEGPRAASGFAWYRVVPFGDTGLPEFGWVAVAGKDGEQWIRPHDDCPPAPRDSWLRIDPIHALACHGDTGLAITGRVGTYETGWCFEWAPPWPTTPSWFDECNVNDTFAVDPDVTPHWDLEPRLVLAFPPTVPEVDLGPRGFEPANWRLATITGQFDHPEARSCKTGYDRDWGPVEGQPGAPPPAPDTALVVLRCRATLVVESVTLRDP